MAKISCIQCGKLSGNSGQSFAKFCWLLLVTHSKLITNGSADYESPCTVLFLQRSRIACNAERCISHGNSVRLFVCLSVRPSHDGTLSGRMKLGSCGLHCEVAKNSSFLIPTMVWDDVPFHLKFALKVTHPPSEKRRLRPISVYNVSAVRASKKVQLSWSGRQLRASNELYM